MAGTPRPNTNYAEEIVADVPQTCWCRGREALDLLAEPSKVGDAFDSALHSKTVELVDTGKLGQTELALVTVESKFFGVKMGHVGSVAWQAASPPSASRPSGRHARWKIKKPWVYGKIEGIHADRAQAAEVLQNGAESAEALAADLYIVGFGSVFYQAGIHMFVLSREELYSMFESKFKLKPTGSQGSTTAPGWNINLGMATVSSNGRHGL